MAPFWGFWPKYRWVNDILLRKIELNLKTSNKILHEWFSLPATKKGDFPGLKRDSEAENAYFRRKNAQNRGFRAK